ncbi:flavodoxin family protein [Desulfogranum marinum]|uniref:flavodoxin family protein n=1 Tax=Desulfogranum marinum TaxID=453220 RepID=UPI0019627B88|nr:flavodoxin family protein [Desulfogranum marinum]MBM9511556.1 flavodoxin family protein [Desulfogranum marinum]
MKVVAFNGSARKNGNTAVMINTIFEELEKEGIQTELIQLSGEHPHGCIACYQCFKLKNKKCIVDIDCINSCIQKMDEADGIILGSPTYFADISTEMKALIDRTGMTARANGDLFKRKIGAAVVTQRRGGAIHAFDTMNHFFTISQMIIVGSSYWNIGVGREKGEVSDDTEGINTMRDLGINMAWALKKLRG